MTLSPPPSTFANRVKRLEGRGEREERGQCGRREMELKTSKSTIPTGMGTGPEELGPTEY